MQTVLQYHHVLPESQNFKPFLVPSGYYKIDVGAHLPEVGDELVLMVTLCKPPYKERDEKLFKVIRRVFYNHHDIDSGELMRVEVTLHLEEVR